MSDFDRNVAADRGGYAGSAVAIDAGLRAHMIRVYNYMASAVALTGVVAYLTFTMSVVTNSAGAVTGFTPLGSFLFGGMFMWVVMLAPLGVVFYLSAKIHSMSFSTAHLVLGLCGLVGLSLSSIFFVYSGVDHPRVLHLVGCLRRGEPVRLHDQARSDRLGLVPVHGPDRRGHCVAGEYLPGIQLRCTSRFR